MKKIFFTLAAILAINLTIAQAPQLFKYQAVVRDASANIVPDQIVGVQIRILQGGTSGTPVYLETHTGTTNSYGLMSLNIGGGTVGSGVFSAIDWSAGPYFLEISIDVTGGTSYTLMGASQLLSVPYALYAGAVAGGGGADADADPTNEYNTSANLVGTDLNITDGGGTLTVDLSTVAGGDDADADPTNEYNTSVTLVGTNLNVTDAGGTITTDLSSLQDGVDDADADPTNEYNTSASLAGTNLNIVDGGGTVSVDLSSLSGGSSNWTASGTNIYNSNTGNVGVGTTSPTTKFHVNATTTTAVPNGSQIVANNPTGTAISTGLIVTQSANNPTESNGVKATSSVTSASWTRGVYGVGTGSTDSNRGVQGETDGTGTGGNIGVVGFASGAGSGDNMGAYGAGTSGLGDNYGMWGQAIGTASSANVTGVQGDALGTDGTTNRGVRGEADGANTDAVGVSGYSSGSATWNVGTEGISAGTGTWNTGIYANGPDATYGAALLDGDVWVVGNLAKGGGTFKIDHPQDPANKFLVHSFVESPDMMNIYNGNVTTDADGYATVILPDYFEAENKDFRYQLTVIGTFSQAIVKEKISGNTFVIQTSEPNVEVSWQVTGVRADKWADAHRVVPELGKNEKEEGKYLHPELYGMPVEDGIFYREQPAVTQEKKILPKSH